MSKFVTSNVIHEAVAICNRRYERKMRDGGTHDEPPQESRRSRVRRDGARKW